ncbi:hypothetical protein Tco_1373196 [Tanacetum coccineum]
MDKARDDLLDRDREREEYIKQLKADLASKTSSLTEAEGVVGTLKGDLECLTVDLSQAETVRHNYVRQLLPTVVQRLLSSSKYKKSLSDVFNLVIAAGWSEGVKEACSEEEAQAVLPLPVSLSHWLLDSFGTFCVPGNGRHLAIGSWTHPERLAFRVMGVTWPLALGLIRSVKHLSG